MLALTFQTLSDQPALYNARQEKADKQAYYTDLV